MSNISMVEAKLPPGFRFHPRDEELVCDYLMKKVSHRHHHLSSLSPLLIEVDLNKCEPWDIPETACVGGKEWYFYTQRDRKYATGLRTNRATASGYWKATGKDRAILSKGTLVGMRKTLVFYHGRAPEGRKSDWVMHEFRLQTTLTSPELPSFREDWVLCRVLYKKREVAAKPSNCSYNLPPLMGHSDDQTHHDQNQVDRHQHLHQQVPCFSFFPPNQIVTHMESNLTTFGSGLMANVSACLDPFSCDTKMLKVALDHLTMMEGSESLREGSSESYLIESGIPNLWNH